MTASQTKNVAALRSTFGAGEFMFDFRFQFAHSAAGSVESITGRAFVKLQNAGIVVGGSTLATYRLA